MRRARAEYDPRVPAVLYRMPGDVWKAKYASSRAERAELVRELIESGAEVIGCRRVRDG